MPATMADVIHLSFPSSFKPDSNVRTKPLTFLGRWTVDEREPWAITGPVALLRISTRTVE
jgi:hypothetical protein